MGPGCSGFNWSFRSQNWRKTKSAGHDTGTKTGHSNNLSLNGTAANVGSVVYVTPSYGGTGTDPHPDGRIAAKQVGLQLTAGAANVTGVNVYAYVIWD